MKQTPNHPTLEGNLVQLMVAHYHEYHSINARGSYCRELTFDSNTKRIEFLLQFNKDHMSLDKKKNKQVNIRF